MGRNVFPELYRPDNRDPNDLSHLSPEMREIYRRNTALFVESGAQEQEHVNITVERPVTCPCCGGKHLTVQIDRKVAITPDGALDPIPAIPVVAVSAETLDAAIDTFDDLFDDYQDLLRATVVNMTATDVLETVEQGDWQWNPNTHRYRNTDTGRIITENTLIGLRDDMVDAWHTRVRNLAVDLADGRVTVQEWTLQMRREVSHLFSDEFMLAKGGRNAMFQADLDALEGMLATQYGYLQNFAEEVKAGDLSKAQIAARSELYMESATQSHERGKAARYGVELPTYPSDGTQICESRCRCRWDIDETDDEFLATWLVNAAARHCATCLSNAANYKPLTIPKG